MLTGHDYRDIARFELIGHAPGIAAGDDHELERKGLGQLHR